MSYEIEIKNPLNVTQEEISNLSPRCFKVDGGGWPDGIHKLKKPVIGHNGKEIYHPRFLFVDEYPNIRFLEKYIRKVKLMITDETKPFLERGLNPDDWSCIQAWELGEDDGDKGFRMIASRSFYEYKNKDKEKLRIPKKEFKPELTEKEIVIYEEDSISWINGWCADIDKTMPKPIDSSVAANFQEVLMKWAYYYSMDMEYSMKYKERIIEPFVEGEMFVTYW